MHCEQLNAPNHTIEPAPSKTERFKVFVSAMTGGGRSANNSKNNSPVASPRSPQVLPHTPRSPPPPYPIAIAGPSAVRVHDVAVETKKERPVACTDEKCEEEEALRAPRVSLPEARQLELTRDFGIVETHLCESQYAKNSVSSCTVMALEASLRFVYSVQKLSGDMVADVIELGSKYEANEHTGVEDVFPHFPRYNRNLKIEESFQDNFKNFRSLLARVKEHARKGQPVACILTKPPESLAILFKSDPNGELRSYLFDSHGRPEIWGPYAGIIAFESAFDLEKFILSKIWSVLEVGPEDGYLANMYNLVDVTILLKRDEKASLSFKSLHEESGFAKLNQGRSESKKIADEGFAARRPCPCDDLLCPKQHELENRVNALRSFAEMSAIRVDDTFSARPGPVSGEEVSIRCRNALTEQINIQHENAKKTMSVNSKGFVPQW
eukprot:TRINITY_DN3022_c0_g1_i1.p1 TRINITY_DN3022_c0_g1~~TRINITY_DN3022_c0_g1_i1.p1  ORF type:complete len:439 (-),score=89.67 TRINITY_DN3022_c0_g1_i1:66-1382(-)